MKAVSKLKKWWRKTLCEFWRGHSWEFWFVRRGYRWVNGAWRWRTCRHCGERKRGWYG